MKPRDFVIEYGPSSEGPWTVYKIIRNVRVGHACVKDASRCSAENVDCWIKIRREVKEEYWSLWTPLTAIGKRLSTN